MCSIPLSICLIHREARATKPTTEEECLLVVMNSWGAAAHMTNNDHISFCGNKLLCWDKGRKRGSSVAEFLRVRTMLQILMEMENLFWKQRVKEFRLREGYFQL